MKCEKYSGWELIGRDPMLRRELSVIEQNKENPDEMVAELIEFYARIDRRLMVAAVLMDEDAVMIRASLTQ